MSPETGHPDPVKSMQNHWRVWIWSLVCLLGTAALCLAQAQGPIYPSNTSPQDEAGQTSAGEALTPVPIRGGGVDLSEENRYGEARSRGAQDFTEDVSLNSRYPFGFSLSASQGYVEDMSDEGNPSQSSMFSAFSGQAFFNAGRRRSKLHLDFGAGYRYHYTKDNLDSPDYHANASYSHQISRNSSLQLTNRFTHAYNDSWSFLSLYSPLHYDLNFANEVVFNRQRITRNTSRASLNYTMGRRIRLGVNGGYDLYRHPEQSSRTTNAFTVGGNLDVRLTDWLSLTNSYTAYLNSVDEEFRDSRIHRLQLSGLDFNLKRGSWRLWMSGGADLSDYDEEIRIMESVHAGVAHTSLHTSFNVIYSHGFTSAVGISSLMRSDRIQAAFGYRITHYVNARVDSTYSRSSDLFDSGSIETYSSGGSLGIALNSYLNMALNGYHQKQRSDDYFIDGLETERVTAYLSIHYVWPSRRRPG